MKQTVTAYAAFGRKHSGEWERLRPDRTKRKLAETDIFCYKAWCAENDEFYYNDFKIMKRKMTVVFGEWEDVCDSV